MTSWTSEKTEYLVIDDGATRDEVFALVTDGEDSGDNEIYVAHGNEAMNVDLGGTDYVFLGDDPANRESQSTLINFSGKTVALSL